MSLMATNIGKKIWGPKYQSRGLMGCGLLCSIRAGPGYNDLASILQIFSALNPRPSRFCSPPKAHSSGRKKPLHIEKRLPLISTFGIDSLSMWLLRLEWIIAFNFGMISKLGIFLLNFFTLFSLHAQQIQKLLYLMVWVLMWCGDRTLHKALPELYSFRHNESSIAEVTHFPKQCCIGTYSFLELYKIGSCNL